MIIVTGGAGFIGSAIIAALNGRGIDDILVVDGLGSDEKWKNLRNLSFTDYVEKDDFLEMAAKGKIDASVEAIFHLGACSTTTAATSLRRWPASTPPCTTVTVLTLNPGNSGSEANSAQLLTAQANEK